MFTQSRVQTGRTADSNRAQWPQTISLSTAFFLRVCHSQTFRNVHYFSLCVVLSPSCCHGAWSLLQDPQVTKSNEYTRVSAHLRAQHWQLTAKAEERRCDAAAQLLQAWRKAQSIYKYGGGALLCGFNCLPVAVILLSGKQTLACSDNSHVIMDSVY